jgi:hypothetical protein
MEKVIVIDYETLGTKPTSKCLMFAAVVIDLQSTDNFDDLIKDKNCTFKAKLSLADQPQRTICKNTIEWWKQQPLESRNKILTPCVDDVTISTFLRQFQIFCNRHMINSNTMGYSRGEIDFQLTDSLVSEYAKDTIYQMGESMFPVPYYNRDNVRSAYRWGYGNIKAAKAPIPKRQFSDAFQKHDPLHDVCKDALILQTLYHHIRNPSSMHGKEFILV